MTDPCTAALERINDAILGWRAAQVKVDPRVVLVDHATHAQLVGLADREVDLEALHLPDLPETLWGAPVACTTCDVVHVPATARTRDGGGPR